MDVTGKRQHVVFAQGVNVDVPDQNHFLVVLFKDGVVDDLVRTGDLIPLRQEQQRLGPALGGLEEAFALRVFAHASENGVTRRCHFGHFIVL